MPYKDKERQKAYSANWSKTHKRYMRDYHLTNTYGLSLSDWTERLAQQGNVCACCKQPSKKWHTDHNHETGNVRAIICPKCNTLVGLLGDTLEKLEIRTKQVREYLENTDGAEKPRS